MINPLLGQGWRFPISPDESGTLGYVKGDTNVEQSLKILLLTNLRERVMRVDFGCDAPSLVFSPGSVQYLGLLETTVREAIRDWEPRVDIENVRAEVDAEDETRVTVEISYVVRQTNPRNNLVFPFYLGTIERI
jgi:phage baseplate assembly protein W